MKVLGEEKGAELRYYEAGEVLFSEGDRGDSIVVIRRGELQVLRIQGADEIELARLGEGSVVGEMSLIDHAVRSATVRSLDGTAVLSIPSSRFAPLLDQFPAWFGSLLKSLVNRLRQSNLKVEQPLVQSTVLSLALFLDKILAHGDSWTRISALKRYHLLSRIPMHKAEDALEELLARGLVLEDMETGLFIPERDMMMVFIDLNLCVLNQKEYPLLALHSDERLWLKLLWLSVENSTVPESQAAAQWCQLIQKHPEGKELKFVQAQGLVELKVLKMSPEGENWILNKPLLAILAKTLENIERLRL